MGAASCHCSRCAADVEPTYPQPRLRKLSRYYFVLPIPFVPLLPIIASDFMVMIPLTMLYMLGVGPALGLAMQKPTCPDCGAFLSKR